MPDYQIQENCECEENTSQEIRLAEQCPPPVDFLLEACEETAVINGGDVYMESLGRIITIDVNLRNVCPNKRIALAVVLTEVDRTGTEHDRGVKTVLIPAPQSQTCSDILISCIKFVLPEETDVSGGTPDSICSPRNFRVRFIANYIDSGFVCCGNTITETDA